MSEVDKRCIYASSEHLKDKFIYQLWHRTPKSKPRFHLFTFGRAEVRVAHYPLGTQNKRLLYFGKAEEHVACGVPKNLWFVGVLLMMQSISLCDHVTERASRAILFMQSRYRTRRYRTRKTVRYISFIQRPITIVPIGWQCIRGGNYELWVMSYELWVMNSTASLSPYSKQTSAAQPYERLCCIFYENLYTK